MESVLHGRCGFPWRVLQQPQAMLELRDAELELLHVVLRHQAELAEEPVERRPRLLAEASRISAPARGHLLDERPRLVAAHHSTVGELVGECVRALRRQRGGAYRGESDALEEVPGRAVAIRLGLELRRPFHRLVVERLAALVLRSALEQDGEERGGDEDRGEGAYPDADQDREREVLEHLAAEEIQRADREQGDDRRRQRPTDGLPERGVDNRLDRGSPHDRQVLAHAVEDDDRVVDRVADDGQECGHGGRAHLPTRERVDPEGDQAVVDDRPQDRHREPPLEAERDEDRDQDERDQDRVDRAAEDLIREARGHVPDATLNRVELRGDRARDLPDSCRLQRLGSHGELVEASAGRLVPSSLDDRIRLAELAHLCAHGRRVDRLLGCELDLRAAAEVDPQVQPFEDQGADRQRDQDTRDREPDPPLADRVEHLPARHLLLLGTHETRVVEPAETGQEPEERPRREDGGEDRDDGAQQEHEGEPAHPTRRDREQDERRDRSDHVRVDDRREALLVARRNGGTHRLPGSRLLLDAFEDDDVRVGRDPDGEDHSREARQGQRDLEEHNDRVEEGRVQGEPENRDDAEEAVDEEQEDCDDREADQRGLDRLVERLLPERRRDAGEVDLLELVRERTAAEDEREILRLAGVTDAGDLRRAAGNAVRVPVPVDRRRRLDLPVEDDREALERPVLPDLAREQLSALGDVPRDVVELLAAVVRELHEDNRALGLAEIVPGRVQLQVRARHLRDGLLLVLRIEAEEVVVVPRGRRLVDPRAVALADAAAEDDRLLRDSPDLEALRDRLPGARPVRLTDPLLGVLGTGNDFLRLRIDEVVLGDLAGLRPGLELLQELELVRGRDREAVLVARRVERVFVDVEEPELGGLADQLGGLVGVSDAWELDRDLVLALLPDLRLCDTERVDAVPDDLDREVEVLLGDLLALGRNRLQDELDAALQVEAELDLAVERRLWNRQERDSDERRHDEAEQGEISASGCHRDPVD